MDLADEVGRRKSLEFGEGLLFLVQINAAHGSILAFSSALNCRLSTNFVQYIEV
jgi:hypothetical protein